MRRQAVWGMSIMLLSAFMFAVPGSVAKPLYEIGWSPGAVVLVRLVGGALVLLIPTLLLLRGQWPKVRANAKLVIAYGLTGVAGAQAFYFLAIERMSIAVAILLEMAGAPIIVVLWLWLRRGQRPALITVVGATIALVGVFFVLDIGGASWDVVGVLLCIAAAACVAAYFFISSNDNTGIDPIAFTGLGMGVGAIAIALMNLLHIMPARFATGTVQLAGHSAPWWVPALLLILFTVGGYILGIVSIRMLGATVGAFVNLTEIPFAAIAAWVILGEALTGWQLLGGLIMLFGIVFVQLGDARTKQVCEALVQTGVMNVPGALPTTRE